MKLKKIIEPLWYFHHVLSREKKKLWKMLALYMGISHFVPFSNPIIVFFSVFYIIQSVWYGLLESSTGDGGVKKQLNNQ